VDEFCRRGKQIVEGWRDARRQRRARVRDEFRKLTLALPGKGACNDDDLVGAQ